MPKKKIIEERNTSSDLSEDDELIEPWENILQYLTVQHLQKICKLLHKDGDHKQPIQLTKQEFISVIDNIIGNSHYSYQAVSLFNEIPYPENEKITWLQLQKFYLDYFSVEEHRNISLVTSKILPVPHIKIDSIIKIVQLETQNNFGYAVISKFGKVGLFDGSLNLLNSYSVVVARTDLIKIGKTRHRRSVWITDAIFIVSEINLLIISTSARSIMFYDASSQKHKPLWLVEGIPDTIQCMTHCCNPELTLLLGSDSGSLIIMKFLQEKDGLFRKKYTDKLNAYYWRELPEEIQHVTIKEIKKMHSNSIHSIFYCNQNCSLISCSRDKKESVVFYNLKDNEKKYIFPINQGISCFSISHNLRLLLTGCDNGGVLLWNSVVTSRPIAVLTDHKTSIVDVKILELKRVAISLSKDGVLKVWDLNEQKCQQMLLIKFPAFNILGKRIEWGKHCIVPGPKRVADVDLKDTTQMYTKTNQKAMETDPWNRSEILISCCNYIANIDINYETDAIVPKSKLLPPPALQNDVIIPECWKVGDPEYQMETGSFDELEINDYILNTLKGLEEWNVSKNLNVPVYDINYRIATLEAKKAEIKGLVAKCAPYLAMDLYEVEEPTLSELLPVPNLKSTQKIAERTHRMLSAASLRSGILSDRSTKSRSSRSSIIEF